LVPGAVRGIALRKRREEVREPFSTEREHSLSRYGPCPGRAKRRCRRVPAGEKGAREQILHPGTAVCMCMWWWWWWWWWCVCGYPSSLELCVVSNGTLILLLQRCMTLTNYVPTEVYQKCMTLSNFVSTEVYGTLILFLQKCMTLSNSVSSVYECQTCLALRNGFARTMRHTTRLCVRTLPGPLLLIGATRVEECKRAKNACIKSKSAKYSSRV
jgi:hypothetical protein